MPIEREKRRTSLFVIALAATVVVPAMAASGRLPPLRNGDIVLQDHGGLDGEAIKLATRSSYSHVGLVEIRNGKPMVIEAVGPVRTIPLARWVKNGVGHRVTVKRIKNLDAADAAKVIRRAHAYDGRPYDWFFTDGRDAIYCSELVHAAYSEGAGIEVGVVQEVKDLDLSDEAVKALIASRWKAHPFCQSPETSTFETCFPRLLNQTLVSPAAIASDPRLETVYSSFGQ